MNSTRKIPKKTKLFESMSYEKYRTQFQATTKLFGIHDVKVTPHGARLGNLAENFNNFTISTVDY